MSGISRTKTLCCLSGLVIAMLASGCAPSFRTTALTSITCNASSSPTPSCNARNPRPETICVVFDSSGCIETQMLGGQLAPVVRPYDQHACPNDDITWVAVRGTPNSYTTSNDKFKVLFMPMGRRFGVRLVGENANREHTKNIYQNADPVWFKYTIFGGQSNCPNRSFDPRIKIDPN